MRSLQRSPILVVLCGFLGALGSHLLPTVGGFAWAQAGCTWDGTTLTCPRNGPTPDDWCEQHGYGTTMTMCDGDVFVGPATSVVYVEQDGGTGSGSNDPESDDGSEDGGDTLERPDQAECEVVGGTWKEGFYCDMPMDEHISADCGCYQSGQWLSIAETSYPYCMARQSLLQERDPARVCQWPFP